MAKALTFTAEFDPDVEAADIVAKLTALGIDGAASRASGWGSVRGDFEITVWADDLPSRHDEITRYSYALSHQLHGSFHGPTSVE